MKRIKLVGHVNYMRAGCPTLFQRGQPVEVSDDLANELLREVTSTGGTVFVVCSPEDDEAPLPEVPVGAPTNPEKAPVNVTLVSGEIDTAMDPKQASKKRFVVGQKGGGGQIPV